MSLLLLFVGCPPYPDGSSVKKKKPDDGFESVLDIEDDEIIQIISIITQVID